MNSHQRFLYSRSHIHHQTYIWYICFDILVHVTKTNTFEFTYEYEYNTLIYDNIEQNWFLGTDTKTNLQTSHNVTPTRVMNTKIYSMISIHEIRKVKQYKSASHTSASVITLTWGTIYNWNEQFRDNLCYFWCWLGMTHILQFNIQMSLPGK